MILALRNVLEGRVKEMTMKKILCFFVLGMFLSLKLWAEPTVFGMELGKMTESELKKNYSVSHLGVNLYSNGNMYSIPAESISFDDIQDVTAIFSEQGILTAVLAELPKSKFDYLKEVLSKKYSVESKNIPFVGDKTIKFRSAASQILLEAPHMSFKMSMNYFTNDFMDKFESKSKEEVRNKMKDDLLQL